MDPLRKNVSDESVLSLLEADVYLRSLDPAITAECVGCFLYIAAHDGCHKQSLEEFMGFSVAAGSRNTDWLSEFHKPGKPGMGLITKTTDPANRRRQILRLTPKGKAAIKQLKTIIYGGTPTS